MKPDFRKRCGGFSGEDIVVAVVLVALLAVAAFGFMRMRKRTAATRILNDLRILDTATNEYAIATGNNAKAGTTQYLTGADIFGGTYGAFTVDSIPAVPTTFVHGLSDVADSTFWSPYK